MTLSPDEMQQIFEHTRIVRKPTFGIVSGYHELPYVCIGAAFETSHRTTRVKGRIHVSPRFIIRPSHYEASYEDIFGEDNVDVGLAGRVFGFMGFRGKPVECTSEHLELAHIDHSVEDTVRDSLDELERYEDITTGVIITPNSRYYPVSVERFIASVLEEEFNV